MGKLELTAGAEGGGARDERDVASHVVVGGGHVVHAVRAGEDRAGLHRTSQMGSASAKEMRLKFI